MVMVVVIRRRKHKYNTWSEENEHVRKRHASIYAWKTADVIARGEEPPCDGLYAPIDMHHYLQRKTTNAIARWEKPPCGGLYA
jgi:hypothetical protein